MDAYRHTALQLMCKNYNFHNFIDKIVVQLLFIFWAKITYAIFVSDAKMQN